MYCGDSEGTAIDHFVPIAHDARRVFVWENHFLACAHCNSNEKRDQYPLDSSGQCLLVDPSKEDPYDHVSLTLSTGRYSGRTPKGVETIRVFGLSRPVLEIGRSRAFVRCKSMLRDWVRLEEEGRSAEAQEVASSLRLHPFGDVLYAMVRRVDSPGAAVVFGGEVVDALHCIKRELS
ncbi:HNH endonuclease [Streptomyces sp. NPDC058867]|uniref:HNH endonuclease n=1 Tax=unclassified Streptomyces TaxID=2593676 RepID=UPI003678B51E